jgi:hypothetical protein
MAGSTRVEEYLEKIPGGINGYPECMHKGEPFAVWLERSPIAGLAAVLPPEVGRYLQPNARIATWVPEVHTTVVYLAIRERLGDDDAFLAHSRTCNRAVLQTPLNRILFAVASPRGILRGAATRWGSLHRGTQVDVRLPDDRSAEVTLTFPPHLLPEIVLGGNGAGIKLALEHAGAREVALETRVLGPTQACFAARWSRTTDALERVSSSLRSAAPSPESRAEE